METANRGVQEKPEAADKKWVLVVDDDPGFRDMLQWYLSEHGFNVQAAQNGTEALEMSKSRKFSLVITDVTMPKLNGLELLGKLKQELNDTAVILATGFGTVETAVYAMKKGASDFILKPFNLKVLGKAVQSALNKE